MPYVHVEEDVKIFVEDLNPEGKQTVFFIHGWPANHKMFEYQFNQLPKYDIRCIAIDIRGFGQSDKPWNGYSYNRLADDLRYVIEAFALDNITLLGFSVGGAICTKYMSRHAGYGVSKLALVSAAVPLFTRRPDYPFAIPAAEVDKLIRQTATDRSKMLSDFAGKFFASNLSNEFKSWFSGLGLEASGHATIRLLRSLRDEDLRRDVQSISVPTTIFHGIHDQIVPFPSAKETHHYIKNSMLIPFEYSGHGLVIDEMEKFNYCLSQFLCM